MWSSIFSPELPGLEKVLRTVLVYLLIAVLYRLMGKRTMASLNTMDFVVMFLLSNVVQNSIIGQDNSFTGGAIGAGTLIGVNFVFDWLQYTFPAVSRLFEGSGSDLVDRGRPQPKALRKLLMRQAELDHAIRLQNGDDLSEVWSARLEPSGQLVITLKTSEQDATHHDVGEIYKRLDRIEKLLLAQQPKAL
jgi:uncharacterized membrane protein YcaP (DUF421 family)